MVASGYRLEQTINLVVGIPCCLLSLFQVYAASISSTNLVAKRRIHICGALSLFFWLLANIDPQAVYGYCPKIFVIICMQLALDALTSALCFIIYSHFQVHYNSINRDLPKYLSPALILSMVWLVTISTTMHCLEVYRDVAMYGVFESIGALIFIGLILIFDLYGYYLIRKVLQELQRAIMENLSPKHRTTGRGSVIDHRVTLNRIFRFHSILGILLVIDLIDRISSVGSSYQNSSGPPTYADPEKYSMNVAMFPIFLVWALEIWWSWIPIRQFTSNEETLKDTQVSTYAVISKNTHLQHQSSQQHLETNTPDKFTFNLSTTDKTSSNPDIMLDNTPATPSRQGGREGPEMGEGESDS